MKTNKNNFGLPSITSTRQTTCAFVLPRKSGRKSKAEREAIIDQFITNITSLYKQKSVFLNVKKTQQQLKKFNEWGYSIGRPILFMIDELITFQKESEERLTNIGGSQHDKKTS